MFTSSVKIVDAFCKNGGQSHRENFCALSEEFKVLEQKKIGLLFDVMIVFGGKMRNYEEYKVNWPECARGPWKIERFEVAESDTMMSFFSYGSRAPIPGTYTRLTRNGHVVMSDTMAEVSDLYELFRKAKGSVLIHGLGLGVALRGVLLNPDVTDVTVVEIDEDVIALVGPFFDDPRITIIHGDAFTWQPEKGRCWNAVWHDIWDDLCTDNLDGMAKLHRRFGRRTDWQGSWGKEFLRYQRSRER